MRRRSRAVKTRHRKTAPRNRRVAPKVRGRGTFAHESDTEIARAIRERDEALEWQSATAEILESISASSTDPGPVFEAILRNLLRLFGTRFALVTLVRNDMIECAGLKGDAGFEKLAEYYPVRLDENTNVGKAIISGQAVQLVPIVGNPASPPGTEAFAREFGYNSIVSVPLIRQGVVIGAINTAHRDAVPFTDKQIAMVQNFAAQAVIAIENTRLLNELRESLEQQTATAEVLKVISSSPGELELVFQAVLEKATRICEAIFGTLYRFDGTTFYHAAGHRTPEALIQVQKQQGHFVPELGTLMHRVMQTRAVAHSADYAAESALGLSAKFGGARSTVVVPMLKDDELIGAFAIYRQEVRPFTDTQIALVQN